MDPIHNYEECVQIETARCNVRAECQGNKSFDESYPHFNKATCIAYEKEHCRTRKIAGKGWDQKDVEACVNAISALKDNCDALIPRGIDETENLWQCAFIDGQDAGSHEEETDTADSATEESEKDTGTASSDAGA